MYSLLLVLAAQTATPPTVRVPLDVYGDRHKKLLELRERASRQAARPAPVVGKTTYEGRSDGRNLIFTMKLTARFSPGEEHQSVPVIGRDVVLLSADSNGRPVALRPQGEFWFWQTKTTGSQTIDVAFVVPPRGPRGSIEYRFSVAESPVTRLHVEFATDGLSPQIAGAVKKRVSAQGSGTRLEAVLKPTNQIHIVGLHDVEQTAGSRAAKVYAQSHNLVSLLDESIELFSVIDFTILYASQKRFRVALPAGYDIVSADGQGAFHYTVETIDHQPVLVGETAFGIRDHYEISLRLKRTMSADERRIQLPIPKAFDVERDTGFVAIEVPGKLSVEEVAGKGVTSIDVRELPETIAMSAVSPVVRAFRFGDEREAAWAVVARYPERALAAGGVDEVVATSVVTEDGRVMTDARFKLRNVLEQYLALELDEGETVESASIDGNPLKPSKDDRGRILLPLVRSKRDAGRLAPFEVQVVYGGRVDPLGLAGHRRVRLPGLAVPVASLEWNVYVPGGYETTELSGPVSGQRFVKNASWHRSGLAVDGEEDRLELAAQGIVNDRNDSTTGAMPVRVKLPKRGQHRRYHRYWIDADQRTAVSFGFVRSPVAVTWAAATTITFALGLVVALALFGRGRRPWALAALGGTVALAIWADVAVGWGIVIFMVVATLRAEGVRRTVRAVQTAGKEIVSTSVAQLKAWFEAKRQRIAAKNGWFTELFLVGWLALRLSLLAGVGLWLLTRIVLFVDLLQRPL